MNLICYVILTHLLVYKMNRTLQFIILWGFAIISTTPINAQTPIPFAVYTPVFEVTQRNLNEVILDNGVYEITVNCKSHTGIDKNYLLEVRIHNDRVTQIYFGNGGSVHSGPNNSGYTWRGGGIEWETDWYGNILYGKAIMQIDFNNGKWQLFTINFR